MSIYLTMLISLIFGFFSRKLNFARKHNRE